MMDFAGAWLVQLAISVGLLWGIGLTFLLLLRSPRYYRDGLLMAPFFGFAIVSGLSHYFGALGLNVRQFVWVFVGLAAAAPLVWLLQGRPSLHVRYHWQILMIGVATYGLAFAPLLRLGYLTTVGTTIDGLSYAVRSEYLQEAALVAPIVPAGHPFYGWVASQINVLRVGDVYLVGVLGVLTGQRSYQLLTTIAVLFYALMPLSLYVFSRRTLRLRRPAALLASGLVAIHNLLLWAVYDNFLSQTIAMSLFPLVLSWGFTAARSLRWRDALGFAVLLSALFSLYPVYAVLASLIGALCALALWGRAVLKDRAGGWGVTRRFWRWGAFVLVALMLTNGVAVMRAWTELTYVGQLMDPEKSSAVGAGNITMYPPIAELFGLIAHANSAYDVGAWQLSTWPLWGMLLIAIALAALAWWRLVPALRLPTAMMLGVPALLALQQRVGVNPPHGYPYGYFKVVSLLALLALPFLAQGACQLLQWRGWRIAVGIFLVGFFALNGFNTLWTMRYTLQERIAVDRELIEIADGIQAVPGDDWLLLDLDLRTSTGGPSVRPHWIGYLLKDRRIHYFEPLLTQNCNPTPVLFPVYQYALVERSQDSRRIGEALDEPWYNPQLYRVVWGNARYELRQRTDTTLAALNVPDGLAVWAPGATLTVEIESPRLRVQIAGATPLDTALSAAPRTVQALILTPPPGADVCVTGTCVSLDPGVWLFDFAVQDTDKLFLENQGVASLYFYRVKALAVATGDGSSRLEVARRLEGVAFVTQSAGATDITYEIALIPPQGNFWTYRLGLHLFDPTQKRYFGVWGLDFAPTDSLQTGRLHLDLASRTAKGWVDGAEVPLDVGPAEIETGAVEVQVVWWRLYAPSYLALYEGARFVRDAAAHVEFEGLQSIPPTLLAAP